LGHGTECILFHFILVIIDALYALNHLGSLIQTNHLG